MFHVKHSGAGRPSDVQRPYSACGEDLRANNSRPGARMAACKRTMQGQGQGRYLFSDAEVPENNIQNILNIDPACHAAKRAGCDAEFFRQ